MPSVANIGLVEEVAGPWVEEAKWDAYRWEALEHITDGWRNSLAEDMKALMPWEPQWCSRERVRHEVQKVVPQELGQRAQVVEQKERQVAVVAAPRKMKQQEQSWPTLR